MHRPLKLIRPVHSQPLAQIRSQLLKVINLSLIRVRPVYGIITNNQQISFQEYQNHLNNFIKHRPASSGPKTPREWATAKARRSVVFAADRLRPDNTVITNTISILQISLHSQHQKQFRFSASPSRSLTVSGQERQ